jgi:hypothetical protein
VRSRAVLLVPFAEAALKPRAMQILLQFLSGGMQDMGADVKQTWA